MNLNPPRTCGTDQLPTAQIKIAPEDFIVDEILGFEPTGEGEHIWIQVRKTGSNTRDLIEKFALIIGVDAREIGYSGLKDKNAITTQWFSIRQPLDANLPTEMHNLEGVELLRTERSERKLRIGSHRRNRFAIVLRNLDGDNHLLEAQIEKILQRGFPNYFGLQRFGHDGRNVIAARSMFENKRRKVTRFKRGLYLSSARAWLFNGVLSQRVHGNDWLSAQDGDVCMLDGSQSVFQVGQADDDLQRRLDEHDIHLTGPLVGSGESVAQGRVLALEQRCLQDEQKLVEGLISAGLKQQRRALRAIANNLQIDWIDEQTLRMRFCLARGVYATSLLREIVDVDVP